MKLTYRQVDIYRILPKALGSRPLSRQFFEALRQNLMRLDKHVRTIDSKKEEIMGHRKAYDDARTKLCEEYAVKDALGKPVIVPGPFTAEYEIDPARKPEFDAKIDELVTLHKADLEAFEKGGQEFENLLNSELPEEVEIVKISSREVPPLPYEVQQALEGFFGEASSIVIPTMTVHPGGKSGGPRH